MATSQLLEQLNAAKNRSEKRQISHGLIDDMRTGVREQTNFAVSTMYREVIKGLGLDERVQERRLGVFSTIGSAALVTHIPRVQGYIDAIGRDARSRVTPAQLIVDAGTGSSALLAAAAARYHNAAHVVAYEVNPKAAVCAQEIMKIMGFDDQVEIVTGDVTDTLNVHLPDAELGITETFAAGLRGPEPGTMITEILARSSQRILPAGVILHATSDNPDNDGSWQYASEIDLTADNRLITGSFRSHSSGRHDVHVHTAYYDALGEPVLTKRNADNLTDAIPIGGLIIPRAGMPIEFSYESGPALPGAAEFTYGE